jgi:hypothetical protein
MVGEGTITGNLGRASDNAAGKAFLRGLIVHQSFVVGYERHIANGLDAA